MARGGPLLERECEFALLDQAIESATRGDGGALIVEGPAGIGKTSLLDEACDRALASGMAVASAQGAPLEQDFGFGVVRQLFEAKVAGASAAMRRRWLAGAAELSIPVVAPSQSEAASPIQQPSVIHGLYWLTANMAEQNPLLITVDDLHWVDAPSLQYLAYVARRLEGTPVLVMAALRTGDPQAHAPIINELAGSPGVRVARPAALSVEGVRQLVRARLGEETDDGFVDACHAATGGVPFLLRELTGALDADAVRPTIDQAHEIAEIGPRTVAHATALRMSRLPPGAIAVAQAIAVLGPHARLDRVATLAGIDHADARSSQDALTTMEILDAGPPLRFVHPLVHRAIYDDITLAQRADAHVRAARLLAEEHAPLDEIAAHLLLSEPTGRADVVDRLHRAADEALARGAPQSAVVYLRRALQEGAIATDRGALLHELASAEAVVHDARAVADLKVARSATADPVIRAHITFELSQLALLGGQWTTHIELLRDALAELGDRDPDLAARIEAARAATKSHDPRFAGELGERLPALRALVAEGGPAKRALALALAAASAHRCGDPQEIRAWVNFGLDDGRLVRDEGSESLIIPQAMAALSCLDDLDAMDAATEHVLADARRRGSIMGFDFGSGYRAWSDTQRGSLTSAAGHLRAVVDVSLEHDLTFVLPTAFVVGADVLLERRDVDDISALVESIELDPEFAANSNGAWVVAVRGRLRALRGDNEGAIADLRAAGVIFDALGFTNPIVELWRSPLALALPPEAEEEARALIAAELADATSAGLRRSQGVALRAAGLRERGTDGLERLRESLAVLDHDDVKLERARTLVALGAALRRADRRVAARDPLREGLELAERCGAERLVERALAELRISGARPRRRVVSGPGSLTPSEIRVARMAADGLTNREIAQALFVTAKTVENQLGTTYRKLDVHSRAELAAALREPDPAR